MTDPTDVSASELVRLYAERAISPREVWEALAGKIASVEPRIQALYAYDQEAALAAASASTERWAAGRPLGRLDGVPVTIKELIATKGVPVPLGSAATALAPAVADAPAAARLREDGAVIFAKTTCPDYGMLTSGVSSFHPLTRNPWDLGCNPGGSSSGAAAAGAAGLGPVHVGTDIGGSIRLPAGLTGLVGFKPSNGRVPLDPYYLGRCAGPMTRTVEDAALAMTALARPDARDATALPPETIDWLALDGAEVAGLRVGLMLEAGCGLATAPEIAAVVEQAAGRFEAAGARIVALPGLLTRAMLDGLDEFWRARLWADLERLPPERLDRVLPYIRAWAEGGAAISGVRAVAGFNQTYAMRAAGARVFAEVDVLLSPTNPMVSYPAEWASPTNDPARPFEHIAFTLPWNMGEQPAISINGGWSAGGMPIGMQLVGPRFADLAVLRLARLFETWRGPIDNWP